MFYMVIIVVILFSIGEALSDPYPLGRCEAEQPTVPVDIPKPIR